MIVTEYRTTVVCDGCGKRNVKVTQGPPPMPVPLDWMQASPPGSTSLREFCSTECVNSWQNPLRPWEEDEKEDEEETDDNER